MTFAPRHLRRRHLRRLSSDFGLNKNFFAAQMSSAQVSGRMCRGAILILSHSNYLFILRRNCRGAIVVGAKDVPPKYYILIQNLIFHFALSTLGSNQLWQRVYDCPKNPTWLFLQFGKSSTGPRQNSEFRAFLLGRAEKIRARCHLWS